MKSRRIAVVASVLIIALLVILIVYPRSRVPLRVARRFVLRGWHILTGDMVDVGGYRLRINLGGKGNPTVVMDSGLTFGRKTWISVFPEVAKFTRVFIYDRAGLGESDPGPAPRTSLLIIKELHTLLGKASITAPYVLVGHSFGGLNVRLYASYYPDEVVGMVLIDASHEDQYARIAALLPPNEREEYLMHEGGENAEGVNLLASAAEVRSAPHLPNVPAVVLSSDYEGQMMSEAMALTIQELQLALVRLLPNSEHVFVQKCGHFIQKDRPELVVQAIRAVVESARKTVPNNLDK
jgi:pimeloyl-ACP methyl ester carboxylesterase